ncbi:hypothetical protein KJ966_15390 [bacterium]|nr:hypothetical protein [bacterium]
MDSAALSDGDQLDVCSKEGDYQVWLEQIQLICLKSKNKSIEFMVI